MIGRRAAALPRLTPGVTLRLGPTDWRYGRGADPGRPVELTVARVRTDLAEHYGGRQVWIDGHAAGCRGGHPPCCELLVEVDALHRAA